MEDNSITTLKPKIDKKTLERIKEDVDFEGQVTIHISFTNYTLENQLLRLWKTTYLFDKSSTHKSKLIQHYNISFYPKWMVVQPGQTLTFTLIFSALPKSCKHFDLIEQIPEPGGFVFKNIARNKSDVYHLTL
jgi:hypothetical protein